MNIAIFIFSEVLTPYQAAEARTKAVATWQQAALCASFLLNLCTASPDITAHPLVCCAGHHRHAHSTSQASAVAAYAQYHALDSVPEVMSSERSVSSMMPSPAPSQPLDMDPNEPTTIADVLHAASTGAQALRGECESKLAQHVQLDALLCTFADLDGPIEPMSIADVLHAASAVLLLKLVCLWMLSQPASSACFACLATTADMLAALLRFRTVAASLMFLQSGGRSGTADLHPSNLQAHAGDLGVTVDTHAALTTPRGMSHVPSAASLPIMRKPGLPTPVPGVSEGLDPASRGFPDRRCESWPSKQQAGRQVRKPASQPASCVSMLPCNAAWAASPAHVFKPHALACQQDRHS